MKQLQKRHISLFGILRDHCLFLTRRQIERILTLPTSSTNRELLWLVSEGYLDRRYYADPALLLGQAGLAGGGQCERRVQAVQTADRTELGSAAAAHVDD